MDGVHTTTQTAVSKKICTCRGKKIKTLLQFCMYFGISSQVSTEFQQKQTSGVRLGHPTAMRKTERI